MDFSLLIAKGLSPSQSYLSSTTIARIAYRLLSPGLHAAARDQRLSMTARAQGSINIFSRSKRSPDSLVWVGPSIRQAYQVPIGRSKTNTCQEKKVWFLSLSNGIT